MLLMACAKEMPPPTEPIFNELAEVSARSRLIAKINRMAEKSASQAIV